jgi:hypothetical protein
MIRTTYICDDSPKKSIDLAVKLIGYTTKLVQILTHMGKTIMNEREDGDDGIWMNEIDQTAFKPHL